MSNIKNPTLTGTETAVQISGQNAAIRNDGTDIIYVSAAPGISAGADGVVSVPAGQSVVLSDIHGAVYLLGTGGATVIGKDDNTNPFKPSAQSGGSGADEVARAAITAHAGNAEIHVTAGEKAAWNAVNYTNPNLLTNPDFAINQRGAVSADNSIGADRWHGTYTVADSGGITFSETSQFATQSIENFIALIGRTFTATVWYSDGSKDTGSITASGGNDYFFTAERTHCTLSPENGFLVWASAPCTVKAVKLEAGGVSTMFCPPDPAAEIAKCQRYYQIRSTGDIPAVDLRPSMRTITDIKQRSDGNYEYIAEL